MGFVDAVRSCLHNYFRLRGRAPRSEFWWFWLFCILVSIVVALLEELLIDPAPAGSDTLGWFMHRADAGSGWLGIVVNFLLIVPTITVWVRRMHDLNRTGWWILLPLPLVLVAAFGGALGAYWLLAICGLGALVLCIVLLVWLFLRGTRGPNHYGEDPLAPPDAV